MLRKLIFLVGSIAPEGEGGGGDGVTADSTEITVDSTEITADQT
jgi:hypothetical protein